VENRTKKSIDTGNLVHLDSISMTAKSAASPTNQSPGSDYLLSDIERDDRYQDSLKIPVESLKFGRSLSEGNRCQDSAKFGVWSRICSKLSGAKFSRGSVTHTVLLALLFLLPFGALIVLLILGSRKSSASPIADGCMSNSASTNSTASNPILTASIASDLDGLFFVRKFHLENQSVQSRRSRRPFLGLRSGVSCIWRLRGWR
jgi:hypothetical protein